MSNASFMELGRGWLNPTVGVTRGILTPDNVKSVSSRVGSLQKDSQFLLSSNFRSVLLLFVLELDLGYCPPLQGNNFVGNTKGIIRGVIYLKERYISR